MKRLQTLAFTAALALAPATLALAQASPMAQPGAGHNAAVKSPGRIGNGPLSKGHNSFTKGEARYRIQHAGYTQVTGLMKDSDGLWQAQAMLNGQSVNVALDYKGNVSTQ